MWLRKVIPQLLIITTEFRSGVLRFDQENRSAVLIEQPIHGLDRPRRSEVRLELGDAFMWIGEVVPQEGEKRADQAHLGGLFVPLDSLVQVFYPLDVGEKSIFHDVSPAVPKSNGATYQSL